MADSRLALVIREVGLWVVMTIAFVSATFAQTAAVVPTLVNYNGTLTDGSGKPLTGVQGVTFYLYQNSEGGSPLWMETQNVQPDKSGHYSVMLGSTMTAGLPTQLFASGEARWLGVQVQGQAEQPRIMLLAVPYALKAGDAQTIGGLPPSAFVLAAPTGGGTPSGATPSSNPAAPPAVGGSGTVNFLPIWTDGSDLGNSVLFQSGTGSTAKIGVNTTTPASTLDIKGSSSVRGTLLLPSVGAATAAAGSNSNPLNLAASAFNSGTGKAVNQVFEWQSEPAGNNTTTPTGTLNLLFGSGTAKPAETGLKINNQGLLTFAAGQTFPGSGTITGVTAGTDLTGGGGSGNVTLNLDITKVPQLNLANTFNNNETINANGGNAALTVNQNATSGATYSIVGTSRVPTSGDAAILGQQLANAQVYGVEGYISNTTGTGAGVFGSNAGPGMTGSTYKGAGAGVWGDAGTFGSTGVLATADKGNGLVAYNNSTVVSTILGENLNTTNSSAALAPGIFGISFAPLGLGMIGSGPVHSSTFNNNVGFNPVGVVGDSSAPAGIGVWGVTDSGTSVYGSTNTGTGVYGLSVTGTGVAGSSTNSAGVVGTSPAGGVSGVYGLTTNSDITQDSYGVWGDDPTSNGTSAGFNGGVYGYSEGGDGVTGVSSANSGIFNSAGLFLSTVNALPLAALGARGSCLIDYAGDLVCSGSKSAAVPLPDKRWVRLYAVESPENWFEDFGSGTLSNGSASIVLDATFRDTVTSSEDYHVFLTPRGECEGLYLASTSASGFEVRELHHGTSNISFDYRIVVRRKGYENIRLQDVTEMQNHLAAKREMLQRPRHRPLPVLPASNHSQAEMAAAAAKR